MSSWNKRSLRTFDDLTSYLIDMFTHIYCKLFKLYIESEIVVVLRLIELSDDINNVASNFGKQSVSSLSSEVVHIK